MNASRLTSECKFISASESSKHIVQVAVIDKLKTAPQINYTAVTKYFYQARGISRSLDHH